MVASQFGDDIDFLDLSASVFDHLGNGGLFGTETAYSFFDIASSVKFPIGRKNAAANCKIRVGAISP